MRPPGLRKLRICDVGAGDLELIRYLATQLTNAQFMAYDLHCFEVPGEFAERIETKQIDLNRLENWTSDDKFDIVICISVIEHVIDPGRLLEFLHQLSARGGLIYIISPDVSSIARKLLKKRWPPLLSANAFNHPYGKEYSSGSQSH